MKKRQAIPQKSKKTAELYQAAKDGDKKLFESLIENGATPNASPDDDISYSIINEAVKNNDAKTLTFLLGYAHLCTNEPDDYVIYQKFVKPLPNKPCVIGITTQTINCMFKSAILAGNDELVECYKKNILEPFFSRNPALKVSIDYGLYQMLQSNPGVPEIEKILKKMSTDGIPVQQRHILYVLPSVNSKDDSLYRLLMATKPNLHFNNEAEANIVHITNSGGSSELLQFFFYDSNLDKDVYKKFIEMGLKISPVSTDFVERTLFSLHTSIHAFLARQISLANYANQINIDAPVILTLTEKKLISDIKPKFIEEYYGGGEGNFKYKKPRLGADYTTYQYLSLYLKTIAKLPTINTTNKRTAFIKVFQSEMAVELIEEHMKRDDGNITRLNKCWEDETSDLEKKLEAIGLGEMRSPVTHNAQSEKADPGVLFWSLHDKLEKEPDDLFSEKNISIVFAIKKLAPLVREIALDRESKNSVENNTPNEVPSDARESFEVRAKKSVESNNVNELLMHMAYENWDEIELGDRRHLLYAACAKGYVDIVDCLRSDQELNDSVHHPCRTSLGDRDATSSALTGAATNGKLEMVEYLLTIDKFHKRSNEISATENYSPIVKSLCDLAKSDDNLKAMRFICSKWKNLQTLVEPSETTENGTIDKNFKHVAKDIMKVVTRAAINGSEDTLKFLCDEIMPSIGLDLKYNQHLLKLVIYEIIMQGFKFTGKFTTINQVGLTYVLDEMCSKPGEVLLEPFFKGEDDCVIKEAFRNLRSNRCDYNAVIRKFLEYPEVRERLSTMEGQQHLREIANHARNQTVIGYLDSIRLDSIRFEEFKKQYLTTYRSAFFKNPFSTMKRKLERDEINNIEQVVEHARRSPNSRTSKILANNPLFQPKCGR